MLEATFELPSPKAFTESKTKFNYILSHLPPDIATVIRDVIIQPDASDSYTDLKKKIIDRCSESKTQEIRRLLAGESLEDRKPSKLLRIMKRRAENHNIDDSLIFELFHQAMPVPVQIILPSFSPINTNKEADVADRILAITPNSIHAISSSGANSPSATSDRFSTDKLLDGLKELRKKSQTYAFLAIDQGRKATIAVRIRNRAKTIYVGTTCGLKAMQRNAFRRVPLRET